LQLGLVMWDSFFFFCGTGAWTQSFMLAKQATIIWAITPVCEVVLAKKVWGQVCWIGVGMLLEKVEKW
jgi:hypothetical protein